MSDLIERAKASVGDVEQFAIKRNFWITGRLNEGEVRLMVKAALNDGFDAGAQSERTRIADDLKALAAELTELREFVGAMGNVAKDVLYCLDGFRGECQQSNYGDALDYAWETMHHTNKMLELLNDPKLTEMYQCDVSGE